MEIEDFWRDPKCSISWEFKERKANSILVTICIKFCFFISSLFRWKGIRKGFVWKEATDAKDTDWKRLHRGSREAAT